MARRTAGVTGMRLDSDAGGGGAGGSGGARRARAEGGMGKEMTRMGRGAERAVRRVTIGMPGTCM